MLYATIKSQQERENLQGPAFLLGAGKTVTVNMRY